MKTYEDLVGERGRRVFYRAERFKARDLFTRVPPAVIIDGAKLDLADISMTGLAATGRLVDIGPGDIGTDVSVTLDDGVAPLFEGMGCVRRVEGNGLETRVAISFTGASIEIGGLVQRHNETLLKRELNGGLSHAIELVSPAYRAHCAEVLHLLRSYRSILGRFESTSRREDAVPDRERVDTLYGLAEERILPEWRRLWHAGNVIVRPIMQDGEVLRAVKAFTEQVITPEFMGGPIWNRSYRKPRGYPGDYLMMNYVYEWRPRGATVYERLLHRIGLDVAECIATRMVMVQQAMAEVAAVAEGTNRPARILSLGCGSAQEVANYLSLRRLPRPVEVTLVDQDHDALREAYERIYPDIVRLNDGSEVKCLQVSFVELMRAGEIFSGLPPQDLIYTVGLVDYLSIRRIRQLAASLYSRLGPDGRLIIGNMADVATGNQWPMECVCDWSLHYRSEAEMLEMGAGLDRARLEIRPDPTGRVYMLYIQKPAE